MTRIFPLLATMLGLLAIGEQAVGQATTYSDESAFLSDSGAVAMESFEMCPWGPIVGTLTGALFRASIDPATSHFNIRGSGSGQVATDGVQLLVMSNDSGAPSATVSFSYCSPTNHFGINITDYGDSGGTGSLTISTDAGHSYLVATTPLPNGTHIFFGLTDLGVPFSVVFITTTNSYDGIGMDEIYSTPPPPVPGIETARLGTPPTPTSFSLV